MAKETREDREFARQFQESLKINKDALISKLTGESSEITSSSEGTGIDASSLHNDPKLVERYREKHPLFSVNKDAMYQAAANIIGVDGMSSAIDMENEEMEKGMTKTASKKVGSETKISRLQYVACQKFPALINFLGSEDGEKIAKEIMAKVNVIMVEKLGENAKQLSKFAHSCKADKQNIKQFYVGENEEWACQVIASGPFRGDEAIFYDREHDISAVLRKNRDDWDNVSDLFNIIHEYAEDKTKIAAQKPVEGKPEDTPEIEESEIKSEKEEENG